MIKNMRHIHVRLEKLKNRNAILLFVLTGVFCIGCSNKTETQQMNADTTHLQGLKIASTENPLAIDTEDIRFSWQWESTEQGKTQTAYEIFVAENANALQTQNYIWDSGKVSSDQSVYIPYEGPELEAVTTYYWQVKAWDEKEQPFVSSGEDTFTICPTEDSLRQVDWISAPSEDKELSGQKDFKVSFDCQTQASTVSFVYGAKVDQYDGHIRWELDASGEFLNCIIYDTYTDEKYIQELDIPSSQIIEQECHIDLEIAHGRISTYIDGQEASTSEITDTGLGGFGFYQGRNYATSFYDNVIIKDEIGNVFAEDFEQADATIFAPKKINIIDGRLAVRHDYVLTNTDAKPAPYFAKNFVVNKEIKAAYLYCTSLGIYEAELNGEKVGKAFFAPGRQSYMTQIQYDAYDISDQIKAGENRIQLLLGHGWFDRAGYEGEGPLGCKAQIVLKYEDGSRDQIVTDDTWECMTDGPIRKDDMYHGEVYDANHEITENVLWQKVEINHVASQYLDLPLKPKNMEQMEEIQVLSPVSVEEPVKGVFVYDFGQEFSGIISVEGMKANKGDCITFSFAEELNQENLKNADGKAGTVWQDNLLMAENTNYYIFGENTEEDYQPQLVCTAFRYVQIEGLEAAPAIEKVKGIAISSALDKTGDFACSSEKLNKLYENIQWTQLSNYLDIPTDCPQRDERFGWSGDAQAFARSAAYNRDTYRFMNNYLFYLREGLEKDGAYPDIVPYIEGGYGTNGWADAGVTITWNQYLQYGDKKIIEDNFEDMCKYIEYLVNTSEGYIRNTGGYGDHNAVVETPTELTNTAQCAHSAQLVARMAQILGREKEAEHFNEIADQYKKAWQEQFVNEDGSIDCWTQAAYTLGIAFDLFQEENVEQAGKNLATCVDYADMHLNTGYIATPYLLPILTESGYVDKAQTILLQESYPSWLYLVDQGATTVHEKWNSIEQSGDFYVLQGSLNHYGLGSINEYFYRYILGIETDESAPGFKHIILRPTVLDSLSYAKGSYKSIYGIIESGWEKDETGEVTYTFSIPANTTATLILPDQDNIMLTSGNYQISGSHIE